MSRQVFLTMGAERFGAPATVDKARDAAAAALGERGLDFPELRLDNGAGLSRETQISARNLARLLLAAHDSPFRSEFESSLALAGWLHHHPVHPPLLVVYPELGLPLRFADGV